MVTTQLPSARERRWLAVIGTAVVVLLLAGCAAGPGGTPERWPAGPGGGAVSVASPMPEPSPAPPTTALAAASSAAAPGSGIEDYREKAYDFSVSSVPAAPGPDGPWIRLTIEGVSVEIPQASALWRVQLLVDPCSNDLRRFLLLENASTGNRIKVDMATKTVTAHLSDPSGPTAGAMERIQRSFQGERTIPEAVEDVLPLPTSQACDPSVAVPELVPAPASPELLPPPD